MKLALFMSTSGHSGVDRSMQLLIPELCSRGVSVDQIKIRKHGPNIGLESKKFTEIDSGVSHTMTALPALVKYLKKEKPDVLLSDKDRANRVAVIAAMIAKVDVKVVVSSGTIMSENLKNRSFIEVLWHKFSMNFLYPRAHSIVVPCRDAATDLADVSSLKEEQIQVVPLPIISQDVFAGGELDAEHSWLSDRRYRVVVAVGELSPRKNYSDLIDAFSLLSDMPDARLVILGKGKEFDALQKKIDGMFLTERVALLGFKANPYAYISKARVFAHTATFEGFGMVLVEALALGIPVVAVNCIGGPKDIVKHGETGSLVPPGNVPALADALRVELAAELSQERRESCKLSVEKYSVTKSADAYLHVMN